MDEFVSFGHLLILLLFAVASKETFALLTGNPFRITLSSDALVSKNTSLVGLLVFKNKKQTFYVTSIT